jgi:hypothetical protein
VSSNRDPASLGIRVGYDINTAPIVARGQQVLVPSGDELCDHDIAIVLLDQQVEGVAPIAVDLQSNLAAGQLVRAVGFGKRGDMAGFGKKYTRAHIPILATSHAEFEVGEAVCSGDSGGPALDSETGAILGVVSRGGASCQGPQARSVYTRADAFAQLIQTALGDGTSTTQTSRPCGNGHRCPNGYHCGTSHYCEKK